MGNILGNLVSMRADHPHIVDTIPYEDSVQSDMLGSLNAATSAFIWGYISRSSAPLRRNCISRINDKEVIHG